MPSFQQTTILIAVVILIIVLCVMAYIIHVSGPTWPPNVSSCPDWWVTDGSGNRQKCINIKDLGICKSQNQNKQGHQVMDFSGKSFTGSSGTCNKYTWANNCKVTWDGLNYGVNNPCS
jgi:hypothetical protein